MGSSDQHASFDALMRPHLDRLYRLAFRLTASRDEAEDLFQDVLIKMYPRVGELVEIEEPGSWLCRVLYNHFIDNQRRFKRQRLVMVSEGQLPEGQGLETLPGELDPVSDPERRDNIRRIHDALSRLSEDHRLVVLLHDTEGYKLEEIQNLTDTPIGTLKSRLHRARARLREILDEDGTVSEDGSCSGTKRSN